MTSKPRNAGKKDTPSRRSAQMKPAGQPYKWVMPFLFAIPGCLLSYFLAPALTFNPGLSTSAMYPLALLCVGLAFFGGTAFFSHHKERIALWTLPLMVLQVAANFLLTYEWLDRAGIWTYAANTLTIPLAIIWFFILKYHTISEPTSNSNEAYAISNVFSAPITKIASALVLLVATGLIFYRLGYFDIWEDENLVINAAIGFAENGFAYFDEGYDRAWMHTILISGVFDMFGVSEFNGRIISAVFGVAFVLLCFYVFARWYGLAWLAILIPAVCLMNDRFLILFRYMRMYALLIPLFVLCSFMLYKAISILQENKNAEDSSVRFKKWGYMALAVLSLPLLAHIHKLSMVLLPALGLFVLYLVLMERSRNQMRLLWIALGGGAVLLFFTFVVQLDKLNMFRQVAGRIFSEHQPIPMYFEYVLQNGLPQNSTLMFLIAGLGLLGSSVSRHLKSLLVFNYLLITIATLSMVYLIEAEGRDYRYVAHIVPFVVCTLLLVVHYCGKTVSKNSYPLAMVVIFLLSTMQLAQDYKRVYVRHPWAPWYSEVYASLKSQYKPGDGLFAQNIKTYYLDPVALAGEHYHKVPKKKDYTMEQFLADIKAQRQGWFMWELHKAHNWRREILEYIYKNFKPIHNSRLDDLGVELFYFDETMIR